ncbi:MAG: alpha/beta fold hydrolase [Thermoplasmatota archaeon]
MLRALRAQFRFLERVAPSLGARVATRLFFQPQRHKRPAREQALAAEGERFEVAGCAAWRFGEGPMVLLVHGWAGRGLHWNALVKPIVEAGGQAVAIDLPAHGETPGKATSFIQAGEKLVEVLAELQPAAVVAHSFGAGAMTYASGHHPVPCVFAGGPAETMAIVDRFCQFLHVGPKTRAGLIALALQRTGRRMEEVIVSAMAAKATSPLLCIQDPEDEEVPFEETAAILSHWPGAIHQALPGVGHYQILWKPEAVDAIMGFLYSTALRKP